MDVLAALVAFPASAGLIALLLRTPLAQRVVAAPRHDRWHERPTPIIGGIGIFGGFIIALGVAVAAGAVPANRELLAIAGGATILFVAGLIDDVFSLGPLPKLGAQIGASLLLVFTGLTIQGLIGNRIVAGAVAVLWLVGMTNAFNLLDNMDGLAATLAAIAAAFFAIDAVTIHPNRGGLVLSLPLLCAAVAFLPFNVWPGRRAEMFMGDSGSQVLGFALAAFGLASS